MLDPANVPGLVVVVIVICLAFLFISRDTHNHR